MLIGGEGESRNHPRLAASSEEETALGDVDGDDQELPPKLFDRKMKDGTSTTEFCLKKVSQQNVHSPMGKKSKKRKYSR